MRAAFGSAGASPSHQTKMIGSRKDNSNWELLPPLKDLVRKDHPLIALDTKLSFDFVRERVSPLYSRLGRPSIPPETVFRVFLIGYLYGIHSERDLMAAVEESLAFRWFSGYPLREKLPSVSALVNCRKRCGPALFGEIFGELASQCEAAGVISLSAGRVYRELPKRASRTKQQSAADRFVGALFEEGIVTTETQSHREG